jgi:hypothetical protein
MNRRDKELRVGRRALVKWSLATGAALGLPQWKVFEALDVGAGHAYADDASCATTNRSVHLVAGTGGFAWFQLLWPHVDVAAAASPSSAWHAPGEETILTGSNGRELRLGPEAPWKTAIPQLQVTCLMSGTNETHTNQPSSSSTVAMGTDLFAACAAIQTANPTLVPVIAIDGCPYGNAQGAPRVAQVGSAADIVSLFNSAASRAGSLLSNTQNAELFSASYSTFLQLRRAAGTTTHRSPFQTAQSSARFLGQNLSDRLMPTGEDLTRYGIDGASFGKNRDIAEALIVTAKAFKMGLTSCVIAPAFRDDPHTAFTDMGALRQTIGTVGRSMDAFMEDLAVQDPTCTGKTIGENTVISVHSDTPKDPLVRDNWPDGTPGNSNWIYCLGAGMLKSGWFGGVRRNGDTVGFNPRTGEDRGTPNGESDRAAVAAVAYAVAKGDMRRVNDFYRGAEITGLITDSNV